MLVEVDPDNTDRRGRRGRQRLPVHGHAAGDGRPHHRRPSSVRFVPVTTKGDDRQGNVTPANRRGLLRGHDADASRSASFDATVSRAVYTTSTNTALSRTTATGLEQRAQRDRRASAGGEQLAVLLRCGEPQLQQRCRRDGLHRPPEPRSAGTSANSRGSVAAHEWGHNWGRKHAPCGGVSGADPELPLQRRRDRRGGLRHGRSGAQAGRLARSHGLLQRRMDQRLHLHRRDELPGERVRSRAGGMAAAVQPALLVWGRIEDGRAVLEPAFRVTARPSLPRRARPLSHRGPRGGRRPGSSASTSRRSRWRMIRTGPSISPSSCRYRRAEPARLASLRLTGGGVQASLAQPGGRAGGGGGESRCWREWRCGGMRARRRWSWCAIRSPARCSSFARGGRAEMATARRRAVADGVGSGAEPGPAGRDAAMTAPCGAARCLLAGRVRRRSPTPSASGPSPNPPSSRWSGRPASAPARSM